jgi:hypothetical protein
MSVHAKTHQQKETSVLNMRTLELSIVVVQQTWGTLTNVWWLFNQLTSFHMDKRAFI